MSGSYITRRDRKTGPRFVVRYRLGGRYFPVRHGGSFKTLKEAKVRHALIAGELAAGRDPTLALTALVNPARCVMFVEVAESWMRSRVDVDENTRRAHASHVRRLLPVFGSLEPSEIAPGDVSGWVQQNSNPAPHGLEPSSMKRYVATLRMILDFAGVEPNPARDKRVKLPRVIEDEPEPPSASQFLAILDAVQPKYRLPLILIEQTALRPGEAVGLLWGDVNIADNEVRMRRRSTKTRRGRWSQLPGWLMVCLTDTCRLEDRTVDRRVFPGMTENAMKLAMGRACVNAKIPHFHPHDLRHRRASLWHGQGVTARELAHRLGHSRPSVSLDVYSHVMPTDEASEDAMRSLVVWSR